MIICRRIKMNIVCATCLNYHHITDDQSCFSKEFQPGYCMILLIELKPRNLPCDSYTYLHSNI